jgi:hypothetical protein
MGRTAQAIVNQGVAPIIAGYTAQQKAGDASIVGSTQTYVDQLGGIASKAEGAYTTAEGQQQSLDASVGSALQTGDVGAAASRLTAALAAAGQDTAPGVAAQAAANSTGASQYASSSAALSGLFAQGANQTAFDAQQPGIARNAGLQALSTYNVGLTSAEQSAVQAAQDKLPAIMSALNASANTQLNAQKVGFDETLATQKANQPHIYGSGSSGYFALLPNGQNVQLTAPGAKAPKTFGGASTGYYSIDPSTGQVTQLVGAVPKAAPKPGAPHTKTVGGTTYQWNGSTWAPAPGIPAAAPGSGKLPSGATSFISSLTSTKQVKQTDGTYKQVISPPKMPYTQAYDRLRALGVADQRARTLLNTVPGYGAGQNGRALLTNSQQAVLAKAKAQTYPGTDAHGTKFLTMRQYTALKAAGALPPGQLVAVHDSSKLKDFPPIYILSNG